MRNRGPRSTITLHGHYFIGTTVTPNTSKRIDIAPVLQNFGP